MMQDPMPTKSRGLFSRPRIIRRFKNDDGGATAIEFAMIAGPFFLLIFAIIESSIYFLAGQYLETSVDDVGRMVRTGQLDDQTSEADFKSEICDRVSVLFDCNKLKVDLAVAATFDDLSEPPKPDADGNYPPGAFNYDPPGPSQIAQISVRYDWPVITNFAAPLMYNKSSRVALLSATAVFRTEPY